MADRKLDIFTALNAVDKKDGDWFFKQSDDAKKEFAPSVFLRWASSIAGDGIEAEFTLLSINQKLNQNMWQYSGDHPELVFRIAASCGVGSRQRHEWTSIPPRRKSSGKLYDFMDKLFPLAGSQEIDMLISKMSKDDLKELLDDAAILPVDSKEIIKNYDKLRDDGTEKPKAKRKK